MVVYYEDGCGHAQADTAPDDGRRQLQLICTLKIALVTLNDSTDVHQWSGLNFYIARSLERAGATVHRVGGLTAYWDTGMRIRRRWYEMVGQNYHAIAEAASIAALGAEARGQIPADADVVLAVTSLIAAALGPLGIPMASWDDATYAAMVDYYPDFLNLASVTRHQCDVLGRCAAQSVSLALYSSDWAAASACEAYGLAADRVAVVPFGPNLDELRDAARVESDIAARSNDVCRLLWIGVEWERKGGPLAIAIARALKAAGVQVELTLVGCEPPDGTALPPWIRVTGFISKREPDGEARLAELYARTHFLVMPSTAEAYGLVYVEAASFGVPSVAICTGGVPTIVRDGETGILEDAASGADHYVPRILRLWRDRASYERMARAARCRVDEVLNWDAAGRNVVGRLERLVVRS